MGWGHGVAGAGKRVVKRGDEGEGEGGGGEIVAIYSSMHSFFIFTTDNFSGGFLLKPGWEQLLLLPFSGQAATCPPP